MLDHASLLVLGANHVAGGVLEEDDRQIRLIACLNKLRDFSRAIGVDRAVITNHCTGNTCDAGVGTQRGRAIARLEFLDFRAVHNARKHLATVVGHFGIGWHGARQLLRGIFRGLIGATRYGCGAPIPVQTLKHFTCLQKSVGIVLDEILDAT